MFIHVLHPRLYSLVASVPGCFIVCETYISVSIKQVNWKAHWRKLFFFLSMIQHSSYILFIRIYVSQRLKICIERLKTFLETSPRWWKLTFCRVCCQTTDPAPQMLHHSTFMYSDLIQTYSSTVCWFNPCGQVCGWNQGHSVWVITEILLR